MIRLVAVASALLVLSGFAFADEAAESVLQQLNMNSSLRAGCYGASRDLDGRKNVGTGALWLKSAPSLGSSASMQLEGWVRNDDSLKGASQENLREGYLNYASGDIDWRIGKQIIARGRADGINPTDNLTPRNYTLLTPENDDQRLGAMAAEMNYHFSDAALTVAWLPHFTPSVYPIPAQPGVVLTEIVPHAGQAAPPYSRAGHGWCNDDGALWATRRSGIYLDG